jgi:hypothetical protein
VAATRGLIPRRTCAPFAGVLVVNVDPPASAHGSAPAAVIASLLATPYENTELTLKLARLQIDQQAT